jgi:hypothetical protein
MSRQRADRPLSQSERMDIFLALVKAQDDEMTVVQS